jgi:hypothetical protein
VQKSHRPHYALLEIALASDRRSHEKSDMAIAALALKREAAIMLTGVVPADVLVYGHRRPADRGPEATPHDAERREEVADSTETTCQSSALRSGVPVDAMLEDGPMDPKTVEKLEGKIEEAIAETIVKMGLKKLPLLPARHTMHLMAKAAVAVYEAAVENQRLED